MNVDDYKNKFSEFLLDESFSDDFRRLLSKCVDRFTENDAGILWYSLLWQITNKVSDPKDIEAYAGFILLMFDNDVDIHHLSFAWENSDGIDGFKALTQQSFEENEEDEEAFVVDYSDESIDSEPDDQLSDEGSRHFEVKDPQYELTRELLFKENNSYKRLLEERSEEVLELKKRIFDLEKVSDEKDMIIKSLEKDSLKFKSNGEYLKLQCERYHKRYESLLVKNDSLRVTLSRVYEENDALSLCKEDADKAAEEIDCLKDEIESLRKENEELSSRMDLMNSENMELNDKVVSLQSELSVARSMSSIPVVPLGTPAFNDRPSMNEMQQYAAYDQSIVGRSPEEVIDYDPKDVISMVPNEGVILEQRSFFGRIFDKFRDREFLKKSITEQNNMLFLKLINICEKKDFKHISEVLKNPNSNIRRIDLYHLIENGCSSEDCIRFFENAVA